MRSSGGTMNLLKVQADAESFEELMDIYYRQYFTDYLLTGYRMRRRDEDTEPLAVLWLSEREPDKDRKKE